MSTTQSTGSPQDSATQRPVDGFAGYLAEVSGAPVDESLLLRALTHRSYAYENGGLPNNERLEFLGDSVLGLVVTDTLYTAHPDLPEGQLAKLRAAVVNMRALADVAGTLGLGDHLLLGRGEESTGGRGKASILADTMEAVIGTVYLSAGMPAAAALVHHLLDPLMAHSATMGAGLDWKTSLQELAAASGVGVPEYRVDEEGPDHEKTFHARAVVGQEVLGTGTGRSKKEAEQRAAELAWRELTARAASTADGGTTASAIAATAATATATATAATATATAVPATATGTGATATATAAPADAADLPAGSTS